ncbi:hypothetical protein SAMN05880593_1524 [Rhizobium sp. RU36D]|nr:hypothetical protein SAMN05880593_1524 [Rhizobium sp. RU36D]
MPRSLPRLDLKFGEDIRAAQSLVARVEVAMTSARLRDPHRIRLSEVELAYELSYLRVFTAWEVLLEEILLRKMCGYATAVGQEPLQPGRRYYASISAAETELYNGRSYLLWHDPVKVIDRANRYFLNSHYMQVIASLQARLTWYGAIRHRIAHAQTDAARKFDQVTMSMAGRRYRASRPGRFFRDIRPASNPPERWLNIVCDELESLAVQLCA